MQNITLTDPLFDTTGLGEIVHASPRTVEAWRIRGTGPRVTRVGPRMVRYRLSDINAWLAGQTQRAV